MALRKGPPAVIVQSRSNSAQPAQDIYGAFKSLMAKIQTGLLEHYAPGKEGEWGLLRDAVLFVLRAQNAIDRIGRATAGLVIVAHLHFT